MSSRREWLVDAVVVTAWFAVLIFAGYGLRDPWPADEPRFALIARDMLAHGNWLFPEVGGDLYQDKPPLHFWLIALSLKLTGSLRTAFLLPSMLASLGTLLLVQDLARRLYGRETGRLAAVTLACSLLFLVTTRGAQIDATLVFFCTLACYGFLRHLLLGPARLWVVIGAAAAALGVLDKAVGFLTLFLWPLAWVAQRRNAASIHDGAFRAAWWVPVVFIAVIAAWLLPMLVTVATSGSPALLAYRDELLFQQTVQRYAAAWHHLKPWYYYFLEVIPALWFPLSALVPWLWSRWRDDWTGRDARVWLPLGWVICVVLFFSLSPGKRGVYVLPALPVFVWAAAPHLAQLYAKRSVQRLSLGFAAVLVLLGAVVAFGSAQRASSIQNILDGVALDSLTPLWVFVVAATLAWLVAFTSRPIVAWPAVLACLAMCWGLGIAPRIDTERSAAGFTRAMLSKVDSASELGLLSYKEQFLLYLDRPVFNFGHARWREGAAESHDAARWLAGDTRRVLLVPESSLEPCFAAAAKVAAGESGGETWWLVSGTPAGDCVARGDLAKVIRYAP